MSAHGSDYKLSDSFLAGIRTVAAIDKAKGKNMSHEITIADEYKAERDEFETECVALYKQNKALLAQNRELVAFVKDYIRRFEAHFSDESDSHSVRQAKELLAKLGK